MEIRPRPGEQAGCSTAAHGNLLLLDFLKLPFHILLLDMLKNHEQEPR